MYRKYIKRILDLIFAVLLLIILITPMIIIWIIIKLDSKGSAIFSQLRGGKNRKYFKIYKFRSMHLNSEDKVTRVGKIIRILSVDELPQIINIIKGNMSFIGPRPFVKEDLELFSEEEIVLRSKVKPGITGFAQINGRNNLSFIEKLEYDLFYVENISLLLDMKILIKTLIVVIKRTGINKKKEPKENFEEKAEGVKF